MEASQGLANKVRSGAVLRTGSSLLRQAAAHRLGRKGVDHHIARGVAQGHEPETRGNVAPPLVLGAERN
jgi:hypothetical protein